MKANRCKIAMRGGPSKEIINDVMKKTNPLNSA